MDINGFMIVAIIYIVTNCICMKYFYNLGEKDSLKTITLTLAIVLGELDPKIREEVIEKVKQKAKELK